MEQENKYSLNDKSLFEAFEKSFDWNLIFLVSIWLFLLTTFPLIFF